MQSIDYSSSFFFVANTPTPDNRAAIAGRTVPNVDVPVFGSSFWLFRFLKWNTSE